MITPSTTIAELAEVLRAHDPPLAVWASTDHDGAWTVSVIPPLGAMPYTASGPDLAAAISAALAKAGAR